MQGSVLLSLTISALSLLSAAGEGSRDDGVLRAGPPGVHRDGPGLHKQFSALAVVPSSLGWAKAMECLLSLAEPVFLASPGEWHFPPFTQGASGCSSLQLPQTGQDPAHGFGSQGDWILGAEMGMELSPASATHHWMFLDKPQDKIQLHREGKKVK